VSCCLQRQNCEQAPFLTFKSAKVRSEIDFGAACKHGLTAAEQTFHSIQFNSIQFNSIDIILLFDTKMSNNQSRKINRATSSSSSNGHHHAAPTSNLESAIALADIYHGQGTTYLHIDNPLASTSTSTHTANSSSANPTGAVVPSISLATTFKQSTPGEPTARNDPNSFGMGYEYSRTGV